MKKLLFIRYRRPGSVDAGGEQGTNTNYNVLCRLLGEENITVYYIHEEQSFKKMILGGFSILINFLKGYYYGLSPHKVKEIKTLATNYPYVFIDRSIFGRIAKVLKNNQYGGKVITFFHNVESVYFAAKIGRYMPWRSVVINCVTQNDQESCDYSDIIIALNERDKQEIEKRYHRTPDILSPVVFKDTYKLQEYPSALTQQKPVCLFLGTYFPMNVHGILWFTKEVLPNVDIDLQVVGKNMHELQPRVKKYENIKIFSNVPDLRPYIENADFMLFPIFEGSGMKVKTCEALMYGKNIIGTKEAFEGYDLNFDKVGACCSTKEDFIKAIKHFSIHPCPRFNTYSRDMFVNNYSEEEREKKFAKIFSD
ncbi:hypothetical protein M2459_003437 [Parabacteroides sp. PF5-5]|uniref:glycosyltransferase n=1 Tax=unclassified Parabacteroides TaxID=2649774 RepID=UPI0024746E37|nr:MULTISPECIES: glycosyltransferase family 4 protein [unclassified Parabacteroides]MDH6306791.1 hypothetical protein [Parabacteroides sp. PH5-39]MDH6317677.1 hypothetical protein [Parabacteroides sp. PF5-13]MDH6321503.1 hypothetical protein [Parabacteroides sp. PH5-13]MDH6325220.1 hypothetical protein [Parabacteroides sp. PH5-8]MDH6328862.1 hypothetical protein [Parabacteroides sp. PH5-41]